MALSASSLLYPGFFSGSLGECLKVNHLRSSLSLWFFMATDDNQPVCAAVVQMRATYNSPPVKDFGKLLTL